MLDKIAVPRSKFLRNAAALTAGISVARAAASLRGSAEAAGTEIPLGVLVPLTGGGAPYGPPMLKSIQATVAMVNQAGGPLGRPLKIFADDDQTAPDAAVTAAQKLISLDHVPAIVGNWSSADTLAILPIMFKAGVLNMNTNGAPEVTGPKYRRIVFRTYPTDVSYGIAAAMFAKKNGWNKAAVMALNNPFALSMRDAFSAEWQRLGMPGTVNAVVYNPKQSSYAGELQKALANDPDVLLLASYVPDASVIVKDWYAANVKTHVIGPDFAINDALIKNVGTNVTNGFFNLGPVPEIGSSGFKAFAPVWERVSHTKLADDFYAAEMYDQVNIVALGIEASRSTRGIDIAEKVREITDPPGIEVGDFATGAKYLRAGKKINYQGASSPCDFDTEHNTSTDFVVSELNGVARKEAARYSAKELTPRAT